MLGFAVFGAGLIGRAHIDLIIASAKGGREPSVTLERTVTLTRWTDGVARASHPVGLPRRR